MISDKENEQPNPTVIIYGDNLKYTWYDFFVDITRTFKRFKQIINFYFFVYNYIHSKEYKLLYGDLNND